jgi:hypothetical protein
MTSPRTLITFALAFLLSVATHAAPQTVRLTEILAVRLTFEPTGELVADVGLLNASGAFRVFERTPITATEPVPPLALKGFLIPGLASFAYEVLGPQALANFQVGFPPLFVGQQVYRPVEVAGTPRLDTGEVVAIPTRATVTPGADPVIGGFVIEGSSRRVLIRGIGPALNDFKVTNPLADPAITLFRSGSTEAVTANDDWGKSVNADAIQEAAAATGAFALTRTSKDAACLVELSPGAYTVHLSTSGSVGGTALLEVYSIP